MVSYNLVISCLAIHFVSDFVLQSSKTAKEKHKDLKFLWLHGILYTIPFLLLGFKYAVVNGIFHMLVDFITSKINAKMYQKEDKKLFFIGVGLDQFIHSYCLISSLHLVE